MHKTGTQATAAQLKHVAREEYSLTMAWRYAWSMALPTTAPPMTMRFARSLPACEISSISWYGIKLEKGGGWQIHEQIAIKNRGKKQESAYHLNVFSFSGGGTLDVASQ